MKRLVSPVLAALLLPAAAAAADPPPPVVLTIHPAAAPVPALRYRLIPALHQQQPGNAADLYYFAFTFERPNIPPKEYDEALERFEKSSLATIREVVPNRPPGKQLDIQLIDPGWLREIDRGARRRFVDWGSEERLRRDGINALLPEVQRFREAARLLSLRARLQLAQGHFDDAVATLETGVTLSRHIGEGSSLISSLVGCAIAQIMFGRMEELIQQPGCPNLYWALTSLPDPLIDIRVGMQGERLWTEPILPGARELLADPKARPMPPDKVRDFAKMLTALNDNRPVLHREPPKPGVALKDAGWPEVRQALVAHGWDPEVADAFPALDAYCLYQVLICDRYLDEMMKWAGLPYHVARPHLEKVDVRIKTEVRPSPGQELAALTLPAVGKVLMAQARVARTVGLLRTVEALRLYAAAHGGKLPAKLADVTEVPIPDDAMTGRPFEYRLEGGKAVLTAPPPDGLDANAATTKTYELVPAK